MTLEVNASVLTSIFTTVSLTGDICGFTFSQALTAGETSILGGLVSQHSGEPLNEGQRLAILPLVGLPAEITSETWVDVGGAMVAANYFPRETSKAFGRLLGQVKVDGDAAVLQIVKDGVTIMLGPVALPDTGGDWVTIMETIPLTTPVLPGTNLYTLQAKVGAAESVFFRFVALALAEII
jgi:hypothetical protein